MATDSMYMNYVTSVHRGMLWILGEYCTSVEEIMRVIVEIRTALGEVNVCCVVLAIYSDTLFVYCPQYSNGPNC